jgi:hypothetical protein
LTVFVLLLNSLVKQTFWLYPHTVQIAAEARMRIRKPYDPASDSPQVVGYLSRRETLPARPAGW